MVAIKEVGFGPNAFNEPTEFNAIESLGQIIYNIFVMKPGTLPSLPNVGIDIRKYLYKLVDTNDYDSLRQAIFDSCSGLLTFMRVGDVIIKEMEIKGTFTLVIIINAKIDQESYALLSALRKGDGNDVLYSFRAESLKVAS